MEFDACAWLTKYYMIDDVAASRARRTEITGDHIPKMLARDETSMSMKTRSTRAAAAVWLKAFPPRILVSTRACPIG